MAINVYDTSAGAGQETRKRVLHVSGAWKRKKCFEFFFFRSLWEKICIFSFCRALSRSLSFHCLVSPTSPATRVFPVPLSPSLSLSLSATRCRALHAPLCQARDNSFAHLFPIEKEQRSHYRSIDSSPRGTLAVFISTFSSDNVRR